ncbi:MAG: Xaa-Pro peptidase family protein [Candidatus Nanopelagicales bacterium]
MTNRSSGLNKGTEFKERIPKLQADSVAQGVDAVVVGPGPDLRYLTGYNAHLSERITALVTVSDRAPVVLVPKLEEQGTRSTSLPTLGVSVVTWEETEDPFFALSELLDGADTVAVNDLFPARWLLKAQAALPQVGFVTAGPLVSPMRERKSPEEVEFLREAAEAIDEVHAQVANWLAPGLSERDVALKIQAAILERHSSADFIIVGSGPNSSAPHHDYSDRIMSKGEPVVVDIGGTMPSGYCSDSTRTYFLGEPDPEFARHYAVLQQAQAAAVEAVQPGATCESIDAVARGILTEAGLGEQFLHRTGHGIGLETHEEPYIVAGNDLALEPGMAFSVEPGFYDGGKWGARIEDIVVCAESGVDPLNRRPHELVIVDC